jgi:hypothetical protein
MPVVVRSHYRAELSASGRDEAESDLRRAWHLLERAHILGQQWPRGHEDDQK